MTTPLPPLLVVDDEKNMRLSLQTMLGDEGYVVLAVESAEAGLELLAKENVFMVITDARLGGMSGYDFMSKIRTRWPELPVLMITAFATPKLAVEVIKAGAMDYLGKPFAPEELLHAVSRCAERHRLLRANDHLLKRANETYQLDQIVGDCTAIRDLKQLIQTVAPTDARALILGESGTGKELIAGALHSLSQRKKSPYVRINCAAIPEALLESELFGHERGAFTGALKLKHGRVEEANGGTIFLDEIADMSRPLQAKLLRFLEDGTFSRIGGTQELSVNVRLIAATNRDIVAAIAADEFREDLFHRLNVIQFRPPPLREREGDIILLAEYFLKLFSGSMNRTVKRLSRGAQQKLLSHRWPGNVRELRNVMERALILETTPEVQSTSLPDFQIETRLNKAEPALAATAATGDRAIDEIVAGFERDLINATLESNSFNLTKSADKLKISRHALRYRMQRLNLTPADEDSVTPTAKENS